MVGYYFNKVLAITAFQQWFSHFKHLFFGDKTFAVRDLFNTGDLYSLSLLNDLYKLRSLHERIEGAGVEPGRASVQDRNFQLTPAKIFFIHIGDLIFAPGTWLQVFCNINHIVIIEIDTWNRKVAFWFGRFFFNTDDLVFAVELNHSVALRIADMVGINDSSLWSGILLQLLTKSGAIKYIVAQYQGNSILTDKLFS